jgi:hypothetical protein
MDATADPLRLYVGTGDGVFVFDVDGGDATRVGRGLEGETVREVAVDPRDPDVAYVACGLRGWGLHRTGDAGGLFASLGFDDRWVWGVTVDSSDPDTVYAGTEPPTLHRSRDRGETWAAFDGIDDVPSRGRWTFFYEPFEAGHVHGVSVHPGDADRVYTAVEHGALVYSLDGGGTWRDALAGHDVHDTLALDDRVLAATAGGLHVSDDAGDTWAGVDRFDGAYVTELVRDPADPDRVYADATPRSASTDAGVYASDDRGESWRAVGDPPPVNVTGCTLLSALPDGTLFHAADAGDDGHRVVVFDGEAWEAVGPSLPRIRAVEAVGR